MPLPTGQLTRHNSAKLNKSFTFEYDKAGNLTKKCVYAYTTGTLGTATDTYVYSYISGTWSDRLSKITVNNNEEKSVTYDNMGNMTSFDGAVFNWQGRQLSSRAKNGTTTTYTYNSDGIRTSKTVGTTKTEYFLNGSQILAQKAGDSVLWFIYDSEGTRVAVISGDYVLYYMYNLQGDVIGLVNGDSRKVVATYKYDAWGNCTVTNAPGWTIGTRNPFRYRGYYYDSESGLYYLNSRYYDPELGRFISPDTTAILTATPAALTDKNLYAYCDNNPVMRRDDGGTFWNIVAGAAVGTLIGVVSQIGANLIDGKSLSTGLGYAAIAGAVGGGLTAAFPGASTLISATMSAGESVVSDISQGENVPTVVVNAALSAGFAAVTSGRTIFSDKKIVGNSLKAFKSVLPGNHPKIKTTAKRYLVKTGKAVAKEIASGVSDGLFANYVSRGTKWCFGLYTKSNGTYAWRTS